MAVKGCMKMELLKECKEQNKGSDPHRHSTEKLNLSLEKQENLPPAATCERGVQGKDPQGGTGRQQTQRNNF